MSIAHSTPLTRRPTSLFFHWPYNPLQKSKILSHIQWYASIYDPKLTDQTLLPIKSEKEWKVIETILEELQQKLHSQIKEEIGISENTNNDAEESDSCPDSGEREHLVYEKIMEMKKGDDEEKALAYDLAGVLDSVSLPVDLSRLLIIVEKKIETFYQIRKYSEIKTCVESCANLTPSLLKDSIIWLSCALDAMNDYDNEEYYHITGETWESLLKVTLIRLADSSIDVNEIIGILDAHSTSSAARIVLSNFAAYLLSTDNVESFRKYEPLFAKINYTVSTSSAFSIEEDTEKSFLAIAAKYHSNTILFYLFNNGYKL
ncbi:MAG: hypothetical protein IKG87_08200 [Clostridia bacterium]|nr:hypothetical protein [Clostridia bacterium]